MKIMSSYIGNVYLSYFVNCLKGANVGNFYLDTE